MIPVELGEASWQWQNFNEDKNNDNIRIELDFIHEIREEAQVREEVAKNRATQHYNTRVRNTSSIKVTWCDISSEKSKEINMKEN